MSQDTILIALIPAIQQERDSGYASQTGLDLRTDLVTERLHTLGLQVPYLCFSFFSRIPSLQRKMPNNSGARIYFAKCPVNPAPRFNQSS